jgi:replicative DNA helicase
MIAHPQAEIAVLGTLLAEPRASFVAESLTPDDFVEHAHRLIFEAIAARVADGGAVSPALLAPMVRDLVVDGKPALHYLLQLVRQAVQIIDVGGYVQALKEYSGRRTMVEVANQMAAIAPNGNEPILPFNEGVCSELERISAAMRQSRRTTFAIEEMAQQTVDRLRAGKQPNLVDTGLIDLNRDIGGWTRGELTILAGRPSMGKTTVALSSMRQAAKRGVCSLFFSMEMSRQSVADRLLADAVFNSQTPIHYTRIIRNQVNPWEIERLQEAQNHMVGSPMRVDDQSSLTLSDIGARARRYQDELERYGKRLDVICLDHLGFVRASGRYAGQRVNEIGEITGGLKELAKSLDVAVLLLCQLNRELEKRDDKRPQLSDLRDSGKIEEDADTVIFAYRAAYYLGRMQHDDDKKENERLAKLEIMERIVELIGLKTRNGPIFTRRLFADMGSNAIRDLAA